MYEFEEKRLEKLAAMRAAGLAVYPHGLHITHSTAEVEALIAGRGAEELAADTASADRCMLRQRILGEMPTDAGRTAGQPEYDHAGALVPPGAGRGQGPAAQSRLSLL